MKNWLFCLLVCSMISCSQKNTPTTEAVPAKETLAEKPKEEKTVDADCPPGVKTACNVPTMTQQEIADIQAKNQQCVKECVDSRMAEAMAADVIQSQCQQGCNQRFFVGQVQVAPSLEAPENGGEPKEEAKD